MIPIAYYDAFMTRLARIVVPGRAHHVTQRVDRREPIFFEDGGQAIYLGLLRGQTARHDVQVWVYCLMPNHVPTTFTSFSSPRMSCSSST
jgi:putative transposase